MKQLRPYQKDAVNECWKALKLSDEPVLLMASVGAGKSLMLANILLTIENQGKFGLCIVNNAELVRNNCATFNEEGGNASIYCAALGMKDASKNIIFGTPQSILNGINKNEAIAKIKFNIIVVDEAHAINYLNSRSAFIRILRHFKLEYPKMRLLGATGTDFRFKGTAIVGDACLFKTQVGNITTQSLINDGYLVAPTFEIDENLVIDFSKVKIKQNGQFDQKELSAVVEHSARLTELICKQVIHIMEEQNRFGVFLFATTTKHAHEILSHLPPSQSALILGDTPQEERTRILNDARTGKIKYLVNIAIISVGVDIPAYDTLAYLRPTESLVLLVQTMGRVLRLSLTTVKESALVLDFAGNIERHQDWDNPILLDALKQTVNKDKDFVIICPECNTLNTDSARRCIGIVNDKRCDYFFEFKFCNNMLCFVKNDLASRHCYKCGDELIDPNDKLSITKIQKELIDLSVLSSTYSVSGTIAPFYINTLYKCQNKDSKLCAITERYSLNTKQKMHIFYGQFINKHCDKPSQWYMKMHNREDMENMLKSAKTPNILQVVEDGNYYKIKRKVF